MRMNGNEGSWENPDEISGQGHFLESEQCDTQIFSEMSRAEQKALQAE